MPLPMANSAMATNRGRRRPKMFAIWPYRGCGIVQANRYDWATQTYSLAPPISRVIVGSDVVMTVASMPELRVSKERTAQIVKMRQVC